jgi:amino acid adenylation domain-containing protein
MDRQTNEIAGNDSTDGTANPPNRQDLLPPQMLTLVDLNQQQVESIARSVPGGTDNVQDIYPLTPPQEGMLFHHLLNEQSDTYVVSTLLELESRARVEALIGALQMVVDRHDILRTAVLWEQLPRPVQVVYRIVQLPVEELLLAPDRDALEQLEERMTPQRQKWNLRKAPLMRLQVAADVTGTRWFALLQLHHVICDHGSLKLVVAEAMRHLEGRSRTLPKASSYRTHVVHSLVNSKTQDAEAFFRGKLGLIDEPTAPFGLLDVQGDGTQILEARSVLDPALAQRVRTVARSLGVTAARLFHATWALVVSHTSGRDDVVFGTALLAARQRGAQAREVLGMFVNTLPLRLRLGGVTAIELVEQTERELGELLRHEDASLVEAQRCSGIVGSGPLFTSLLGYRHSVPSPETDWSRAPGIRVLTANQYRTNYPVSLTIDNLGDGYALTVQTHRRIDPSRVAKYLERALDSLVQALIKDPQTPALSLSILPDSERRQIIDSFNSTQAPYPKNKLIHELFQAQAERTPEATAVIYEDDCLTYAQLNEGANQLAHYLINQGVEIGERIPILMPRCVQLLISQLAVLKCGGAYVPLDTTHPIERQAFMIRDCGARRILAEDALFAQFGIETVQCIDVTRAGPAISEMPKDNLRVPLDTPAPAYVMYTSGSTGAPKGVVVPHRAVNRLVINNGYATIEPTDRIAFYSNPAFDASTFEVWAALLNGASVLTVPQSLVLSAEPFADLLRKQRVTVLWMSTGLFMQYRDALSEVFPQLRYLLVGGDVVEPSAVRWVLCNCPPRHLLNGYGPTECTTFSATYLIESADEEAEDIPIGRPISNTQIYILDANCLPVPIGVAGEIHIGGDGVALGYLNRPELSAQKFIPDPFSSDPQSRLYKSGDLGRWREDGVIEFLGRLDDQVKIRGFRVELGEIEAHLVRHNHVKNAVVIARVDAQGRKLLAAYVVADLAEKIAPKPSVSRDVGDDVIAQWQHLYEETYSRSALGPSFVGWHSSYTGTPIPEPEMQEWLTNTVNRIQRLHPSRVLEIGCGVGLLLQHLAPQCGVYVGTDFSASALGQLRQWLNTQRHLAHVKLLQRPAVELDGLEDAPFDVVILNSVVQYFPDIDYLLAVLQRAIPLVRPGGTIFVGDVRHLGTLPTFHGAVQLSKAAASLSIPQLRQRIARAVSQDKELVIDPQFFRALPGNLAGVSSADVHLKRGRATNELNCYRYDAILQVGGQLDSRVLCEPMDWQTAVGSLPALEEALCERRWSAVSIQEIPDQRLAKDSTAQRLIEVSDDRTDAGTLRNDLNALQHLDVDPEDLWRLAERHDYDITLSTGKRGYFAAELLDRRRTSELMRSVPVPDTPRQWTAYANNPLQNALKRRLSRDLRKYLGERLPQYMVPSMWMVVDQLPLTANGKVNRRALPAPQNRSDEVGDYIPPRTETEAILADIWTELFAVDRVGLKDNFFELGGHSLLIVQLIERLRRIGKSTSVRTVYEAPTLEGLASRLVDLEDVDFAIPPNLIPQDCATLSPAMLPLVALAPEHIARIAQSVPGGSQNIQDIYPLSPAQEGMLFHRIITSGAADAYTRSLLLSLPSRNTLESLIAAIQEAIDRHDILRTAILWEGLPQPVQVVYRQATLPVEEITGAGGDPLTQFKEQMKSECEHTELGRAPLLRLQITAHPHSPRWYALIHTHHLIFDNQSLQTLFGELIASVAGRARDLPTPVPYRNHVARVLAYARSANAESFFRDMLGDVEEPTAPFGILNIHGDGSDIAKACRSLPAKLARQVRTQAGRFSVSAAILFHAVWAVVVSRTSGRDDVVFGSVLLGRLQGNSNAQGSMGMFINTLPLRVKLRSTTAKQLLDELQRAVAELLNHEQASLAVAQRCSGVPAGVPLFSTLLNYVHRSKDFQSECSNDASIALLATEGATNYPIVLSVYDSGEEFVLEVEADGRLDAERILGYVSTTMYSLLEALELAPQTPALSLSLFSEEEHRQLTQTFNATAAACPHEQLIHQMFEAQVRRSLHTIAVAHEDQSLTYAELNKKANRLARHLRAMGVGPGQRVGIYAGRSLEVVVGILAILKAGGAYVPLDPDYPAERLQYMIEDAEPRVVLVAEGLSTTIVPKAAKVVPINSRLEEAIDADDADLDPRPLALTPRNLAYVIYTSGSTGEPKGVLVEHENLVASTFARAEFYGLSAQFLLLSSFAFDSSLAGMFGTLTTGGTLRIASADGARDPVALLNTIRQHGVTDLLCVPSLYQGILASLPLGTSLGSLRRVIVAGEACPPSLLQHSAQIAPETKLFNEYGPTETTVWATVFTCQYDSRESTVSIGSPIANTQIYILDRAHELAPIKVPGEIYIGGAGVSRGYLNRPDQTAERFLPDPFHTDLTRRIYRTGDLGRWRADGTLEYLGRNDNQVKVRGFRIELSEIEVHLSRHRLVKEAVIVTRDDALGEKQLVAYVVPHDPDSSGTSPTAQMLRKYLAPMLPQYMVPSVFVTMEKFPLTPNGKLDRASLPAPGLTAYVKGRYEAPIGEVEGTLANIWQDVLKLERVGRSDNFFELGGHSLLATRAISRVNERLQLQLSVKALFEAPTVAEFGIRAEMARQQRAREEAAWMSELAGNLSRENEEIPDDEVISRLAALERELLHGPASGPAGG